MRFAVVYLAHFEVVEQDIADIAVVPEDTVEDKAAVEVAEDIEQVDDTLGAVDIAVVLVVAGKVAEDIAVVYIVEDKVVDKVDIVEDKVDRKAVDKVFDCKAGVEVVTVVLTLSPFQ